MKRLLRERAAEGVHRLVQERLQKIIARAGLASRRKAEELILSGKVTVNGKVVRELGSKADPQRDFLKVNGKLVRPESLVYFAVHKPAGVLCTASDPRGRPIVTSLVRTSARVYPAGRLDADSEGLVILTNDGELTKAITDAGKVAKVYRVKVQGLPGKDQVARLQRGIKLRDGTELARCKINRLKAERNSWFEVILYQGKNRQIRRMFEEIGHSVMRLKRIAIGPVLLGRLRTGMNRKLTNSEIEALRNSASGKKSRKQRVS